MYHFCYIESGYPHPHGGGGAGTYVQITGRELVRRGHQVSVIAAPCPSCPPETLDQGVRVYRPGLSGPWHWYLSKIPVLRTYALAARSLEYSSHGHKFLLRLHQKSPVDLVEFSDGGDFWLALRKDIPYIVHQHGSRYTTLRMSGRPVGRSGWYERKIGLFCIRRADWVFSPSQAMLEIVEKEAGRKFEWKSVLPYPLDPDLLDEGLLLRPAPHSDHRKVVLFAARNDPVKGADVLMQAIPRVMEKYPQVEFRLFGYQPGPDENIPDGVQIHPFVPKEALREQYRQADVCVIPSRWDNSPNTVYEAMAAGKAVVASRVGGIPELVLDGVSGLLVEPGQPGELANAMVRLLSDDSLCLKMGLAGKERIRELASLQENVNKRVQIYEQVIRAHHSG
jgi:glycosyltransferase involved in cell wall biosynthesis